MIKKDLSIRRGSRAEFKFEVAGDCSDKEISFVVKASMDITDQRLIDKNCLRQDEMDINFDSLNGRTVLTLKLKEEDTYSINSGNFYYDFDDLSSQITLYSGLFEIIPDIQTPFDGLEIIPTNLPRAIILNPADYEENAFIHCVVDENKKSFSGISVEETKMVLGVDLLETGKVDKIPGKGLSENDFTAVLKENYDLSYEHLTRSDNPHNVNKVQVGLANVPDADATNPENISQNINYRFVNDGEKSNWNSAYSEKHTHINKTYLDTVNQNMGISNQVQFSQLGLGRGVLGTWSVALQAGLSTRSGSYLDWEGGNARLRENNYNFEFLNYDGSSLLTTFKMGAAGNVSYRPISMNGISLKIREISANYTVVPQDNILLVTASTSDKTILLPVTNLPDGTIFIIKKVDNGSGKVIIQPAEGLIEGVGNFQLINQFETCRVVKSSSGYYLLSRML